MRRSVLTAALAATLTAGLAGCTDDGAEALKAVRAAGAATVEAGTAQVAIVVNTDVGGTETTLTGDGGFDLEAGQGVLSLNLGSLLSGTKLDARIVRETAYVAPPAFLVALVGKPFLRVDLLQLVAESPQFGPITSTANPVTSVDALRGATSAEEVGAETVRGETTTHYRGTIDLSAAVREVGDAGESAMSRLVTLMRSNEVPYDVWLDTAGRVRRVTLTADADAEAAGGSASPSAAVSAATTVTTELFEFGSAVQVTVPPADQVADGNAILKTIAGSRSSG